MVSDSICLYYVVVGCPDDVCILTDSVSSRQVVSDEQSIPNSSDRSIKCSDNTLLCASQRFTVELSWLMYLKPFAECPEGSIKLELIFV